MSTPSERDFMRLMDKHCKGGRKIALNAIARTRLAEYHTNSRNKWNSLLCLEQQAKELFENDDSLPDLEFIITKDLYIVGGFIMRCWCLFAEHDSVSESSGMSQNL
jgi:hypothetical protein